MRYTTHETSIHGITVDVDVEPQPVMDGGWHANFVGCRAMVGEKVRGVHVMSRHAGGEIRGYVLDADGGLRLRGPCYTGRWESMDEEVAAILGARVVPYVVFSGGGGVAPAP